MIAIIKMKRSEEIREELLKEIQNKTMEKHNSSIESDSESDKSNIIAENTLIRQLVDEFQDKNQILKDIELQKQKTAENQPIRKSYSEVISGIKPKPKKVPKITIKTTDVNQEETMMLLKNCIFAEKSIRTKFIRTKNDTEIEISCKDTISVETAQKAISSTVQNVDLKIEQQGNPKIKIVGIQNDTEMDEEQLEEDINNRNFSQFQSTGKILYKFTNNRTKTDTVLMEVTSEIYKHIRENNNRIFIGHQYCRVYDLVNTTPCLTTVQDTGIVLRSAKMILCV